MHRSLAARRVLLVALSALAAPAGAQAIAGSFSPNPVAPGVPFTLTITDATGQGLTLSSPCTWFQIHQGAQTGPFVSINVACPAVLVPVPPNGTYAFTWDQRDDTGQLVPPGTYWFDAHAWSSGFTTLYRDWFCISIQPPGEPALTAAGAAHLGQNTPLQISAPAQANALYIAAASLSSNDPITVPGLATCLSAPIFIGPFTAPVGALDGGGSSNGLELIVPAAPSALWQGLHVQALLLGNNGLALTNDLSFTVQP